MGKIKDEAKKDPREHLIVTILSHTGMRSGGLRNIKMENIYDYENNELLQDGWSFDKNMRRYFSIRRDIELMDSFNRYFVEYPEIVKMKGYLFPFKNKLFEKHTSRKCIANIVKDICNRCGIDSTKIHVHMFRKTVVTNLMKNGNTMEKVSKFIGHSDPSTTFTFYWVPTVDDLTDHMIITWLKNTDTYVDLKNAGQLQPANVNADMDVETETTSSQVGNEYLRFIRKVYWPLKKQQEILKESLDVAIAMLTEANKNKYLTLGDKSDTQVIEKLSTLEKQNDWDKSTIVSESID